MAETATRPSGAPAQPTRSRGLSEKKLAFAMVSPSMLLIALVAAYPILYGIWLSLHEYSVRVAGLSRWAGLSNYTEALGNSEFWSAMGTTLVFTAVSVTLEFLLGLAMAMAMHAAFRGQGLLRTVILIPWSLLTVVTGFMWRSIFESPQGLVNTLLGTDTVWLGQKPNALIVIIIADVWKTAPFMALLILAGLQTIPGEIYDAAKVDGAKSWQRFTKITLPLLVPAILVALIFRTLDALRIFDLPYVLTKGANGTNTLSLLSQQTFAENRIYGLGSAYAILTFITVMIVAFIYIRTVGGNIRGIAED
jgi:multiple sugar transport system permease protein